MREIHECIGDIPNLSIISYQHQTIIVVVANIFPNAHHDYCAQYLKVNIHVKYKR